ncbi:MAG: O-antigen ligase family protein [Planctomycetales bacterium]|nr:O-antigen ligase family protein [Planctomycetales bacterium]
MKQPSSSTAERFIEAGILCVLFLCPLFLGGRHPLGRLVFVGAVFATAVIWAVQKAMQCDAKLSITKLSAIPYLGVALVLLQAVTLPSGLLAWLSPNVSNLLPSIAWRSVSLSPAETRIGFAVLLAYVAFWTVLFDWASSDVRREKLIRWVAGSGVFMASLALLQYLLPNGRYLWVHAHPFREPTGAATGAFENPNHFAHFVTLGLGPLLWVAWKQIVSPTDRFAQLRLFKRSKTDERTKLRAKQQIRSVINAAIGLSLAISLVTIFLSYSRGGLVVALLAIAVLSVTGLYVRILDRRCLLGGIAATAVCTLVLLLHGMDKVGREIGSLNAARTGNDVSLASRQELWATVWRGTTSFPRLGVGAGAHRDVYPAFLDRPQAVTFTHAESSYLQVLFEAGWPGFVLVIASVFVLAQLAIRFAKSARSNATANADDKVHLMMTMAAIAGVCVALVHAVFDFVWHIPACMSLAIVLVVVFVRGASRQESITRVSLQRSAWIVLVCVLSVVGIGNVKTLYGPAMASRHWDDYLTVSLAQNQKYRPITRYGRQRTAAELVTADSPSLSEKMIDSLQQVIRYDPRNGRAHSRLASLTLEMFDHKQTRLPDGMGLASIRDAAYASEFHSAAELHAWLDRAVGKDKELLDVALRHAKRSIELCPMEASSYLYLADLAFMQHRSPEMRTRQLQQAARLRQVDGTVLMAMGQEYAVRGNAAAAFAQWRNAFHLSSGNRKRVIETLSNHVPVDMMLAQLQPDIAAAQKMFAHYRADKNKLAMEQTAAYLHDFASQPNMDLEFRASLEIADALSLVKDFDHAMWHLQSARKKNPHDYGLRLRMAQLQLKLKQFSEAEENLRWCKRRRSDDQRVDKMLQETNSRL